MSFLGSNRALLEVLREWSGRMIGCLLCGMAVFSPWAFGTTEAWSIMVMNIGGWLIGALFIARQFTKFELTSKARLEAGTVVIGAAGAVTVVLLLYLLVSAANAASIYVPSEWRMEQRPHIRWLPHSFDGPSSWKAFWRYVALAGVFWGTWDWIGEGRNASLTAGVPRVSSRLQLLLWLLAINGAVVSAEAILQRTSGTPNLLWIKPTQVNRDALAQLGPFPYRANGAQYLNLIWPVALGFWWWLNQDYSQRVTRRGRHHVLLPCVVVMASAALFSLSRGGVGVAALMVAGSCMVLALRRGATAVQRWSVIILLAGTTAGSVAMSWKSLSQRLETTADDPLQGRREIYEVAREMAGEYPWFGLGPGTFDSLFQMYRRSPEQYWPGQVHDDWLEFRVTLGWMGLGIALIALVLTWMRCLFPGGVLRESTFLMLVSLALAGCLLHARFDFPFQIYSIQFVFLVLLAIVFSSSISQNEVSHR